ncbi:Protein of unknown function [Gryllus bimaculatus]|nr:Protein of unknown function [Gryllus bimaculatus]
MADHSTSARTMPNCADMSFARKNDLVANTSASTHGERPYKSFVLREEIRAERGFGRSSRRIPTADTSVLSNEGDGPCASEAGEEEDEEGRVLVPHSASPAH